MPSFGSMWMVEKKGTIAVHIGQVEIQSYGQVQNIGMYDGARINFGK